MANTENERSLEKREAQLPEGVEHTRETPQFAPPADVYEIGDTVRLVADMPGVGKDDIDITLERNVLTIRGRVDDPSPEGLELVYAEYRVGDFVRNFSISDEVDRDRIEAHVKDGVLTLTLPKKQPTRKLIEVKGD